MSLDGKRGSIDKPNPVDSEDIADGSITNIDINASAAIAVTKLANGTADQIVKTNSGGTALEHGLIADANIDAGAAIGLSKLATDPLARANHTGTQTASTISDLDSATVTFTNKTIDADGVGNSITNIEDANIKAGAAIALSKLATDPLARANHTGTQTASTISDFDTQVRTSRLDQMAIPTATVDLNAQILDNVQEICVGLISDETNTVAVFTITDTTGAVQLEQDMTIADATDIILNGTTGTKIGTATTQKLGFYNATPVVQPTALTSADAATVDATYGSEESGVINNIRTRVGEIESKLQALGLLA